MGIVEEAHNVRIVGRGNEIVVLAHGFGTDQSVWKHLVPHLVDDYRVILYDNMGAGTTNPEYFDFDRYYTIDGFVYDLLAILEELQVKSCIFVGHSLSAMVGLLASISHPHLFTKFILVSASPRSYYTNLHAKIHTITNYSITVVIFISFCPVLKNYTKKWYICIVAEKG